MTCCTYSAGHLKTPGKGAAGQAKALGQPSSYVEVMGTWDFKWPQGKVIRVAFQEPQERAPDLYRAIETIQRTAATWIPSQDGGAKPNISFEWMTNLLPPGERGDLQGASAYNTSPSGDAFREYDYDVLVSLDPLPRDLYDPLTGEHRERIFLPQSQLGSFARRLDYGVPTIYLGPFAKTESLTKHYESKGIAYYVLHEFGHVLGLGHAHQSPRRRQRWKADAEKAVALHKIEQILVVARRISDGMSLPRASAKLDKSLREMLDGATVTQRTVLETFLKRRGVELPTDPVDFVLSQIIAPWPGNIEFSDWPDKDGPSVMDIPYFDCMMAFHEPPTAEVCDSCEASLQQKAPSAYDMAWLEQMYPPVSNSQKSARS
jgi:hypothetical protein